MISKGQLSLVKQCDLLSIHRSGLYYKPKGESSLNLELMRKIDEYYLHHPFRELLVCIRGLLRIRVIRQVVIVLTAFTIR